MIKNSIEKNGLNGALINLPINVTFVQTYTLKKAPWSYW